MTKEKYLSYIPANEDQFSAATYQYINFNYPTLRRFLFHVPNEGSKSAKEGAKLKAMGVVSGIPDYICVKPLFALELKMPNGKLSKSQQEIKELWEQNVPYCVAYCAQDIVNFLKTII
jgi:hypothetical protein